jgi:hypothetical protein
VNKQKILIISAIGLFALSQYLLTDYFFSSKQSQLFDYYQEGYEDGLIDSVSAIFFNIENCEATSISFNNITKYVIDIDCLDGMNSFP